LSEKEKTELNDKADKLPGEVRDHMLSLDIAKTIQNLMSVHTITEKQAIIVAVLIRRIFLKDSSKNELVNDLTKYANINPAKAREIGQYLEDKVFATIPKPATAPPAQPGQEQVVDLKQK
jgi:hypothetical protein